MSKQAIIWTKCRNIVNLTLRNKLQLNLYWKSYIFIQEKAFQNIWKMVTILSLKLWYRSSLLYWTQQRCTAHQHDDFIIQKSSTTVVTVNDWMSLSVVVLLYFNFVNKFWKRKVRVHHYFSMMSKFYDWMGIEFQQWVWYIDLVGYLCITRHQCTEVTSCTYCFFRGMMISI